ncbi:cache domain-containing protein [Cupriavidus pauculus]|jgi:two-component system NarL family sensor kinase|uniref:cache domain-containing protein n=1 Tax=Cupriavidus pauculus TaxID=82633 RepID=UPI0012482D80|nr:cache domain-containing protein [Cupriavidus pauculus]KAB0600718.1 histidine kinase [Cupriavidus pauculus]MCM3604122.1 cache domain-containing protein [Cupriavidus pauculus]UAL01424.1 cache domain-containing protein [Cupriavidus pauculus]
MKLRQKILLLAVAPLAVAMLGIALAVRYQATALARHERALVEAAYLQSKETELRHYVELAQSAIAPLVQSGRTDAATRQAAMEALARLDYGPDGYFFLYDLQGRNLMHPRQPELVGQDLWLLRDPQGALTIQKLVSAAKSGGGSVRYLWRKPSSQQVAPKLGYVVAVPAWNWMLGTGIYLDDVEQTLRQLDARAETDIRETMAWIGVIAAISILLVAASGLALNISEHREADAKLRQLAQRVVQSQEEERARLSRELHDGISQLLVSVKLVLEAATNRIRLAPAEGASVAPILGMALNRLDSVFNEVRRVARNLRPALLDDLGLFAALQHLAREMQAGSTLGIDVRQRGQPRELSDDQATALFRIAQEALTNVERHAHATHVDVELEYLPSGTRLVVRDNGTGFDVARMQRDPQRGIGLRNLRERMAALGGQFDIVSLPSGTRLTAALPLKTPSSEPSQS